MKQITLLSLAIFSLLLTSCNPEEVTPVSNNNTSGPNIENVASQLIGTWYLDRIETYHKICSNGERILADVQINNLTYSNYTIEFTNALSTTPFPLIDVYDNITDVKISTIGSGIGNANYAVYLAQSNGYNSPLSPIELGHLGLAFFGDNAIANILPIPFSWGGEIVQIDNSTFSIEAKLVDDYIYRAVFKKSNQTSLPLNSANLASGTYSLVSKKHTENGVLQNESTFGNDLLLTLTDEVNYTFNPEHPGFTATYSDLLQYEFPLNLSVAGEVLWSSTQNFISTNSSFCKIHFKDDLNLILRDYTDCNTYYEYSFIKVN